MSAPAFAPRLAIVTDPTSDLPDQLDLPGFLPDYLRFNPAPPVPAALLSC